MRVAQIAPLWEAVPPVGYGAVESLVADLTEGLVARGHQVTLFASGDSKTTAELIPAAPRALHSAPEIREPEIYRMLQLALVRDKAAEFDVIHAHLHSNSGSLALPMLHGLRTPVLHTVHGFINTDNIRLFHRYRTAGYVALSRHQRSQLNGLNIAGTVPNGIDVPRFPFTPAPHDPPYLAFLGRIRPEKGVHRAFEVARRTGVRLKIAGRVKPQDQNYFNEEIKPHIDRGQVDYVGELGFDAKTAFLGGALACLSLSLISEPFGLVNIEAVACGTPVLALANGALPEVIRDGINGFVRPTIDDLINTVPDLPTLDREACRRWVASEFSLNRMITGYECLYRRTSCAA